MRAKDTLDALGLHNATMVFLILAAGYLSLDIFTRAKIQKFAIVSDKYFRL